MFGSSWLPTPNAQDRSSACAKILAKPRLKRAGKLHHDLCAKLAVAPHSSPALRIDLGDEPNHGRRVRRSSVAKSVARRSVS